MIKKLWCKIVGHNYSWEAVNVTPKFGFNLGICKRCGEAKISIGHIYLHVKFGGYR